MSGNAGNHSFSVMFFLPELAGGGAEMNAVRLAKSLLDAEIQPIYVVMRGPGGYAKFLPEGVEEVILDTGRINSSTFRLIRSLMPLARLIDVRKPDVLCPIMVGPGIIALEAARLAKHKLAKVLSIQNSLSVSHGKDAGFRERLEMALIKRRFPKFDSAISLSTGVGDELLQSVPALRDRIEVIPNVGLPLSMQLSNALSKSRTAARGAITLLACGRLTHQKDYPTLLRAFACLQGPELRLNILGDGELRESLQRMVADLGLVDCVTFLGFQDDPFSHMRVADIFVLSSRWEGFGNVLVEAMAMGTPVVSTDCAHGPAEIITDGETGLLVPVGQVTALAEALQRLIDDPILRDRLGKAGQKRAEDFSAEKIGADYARHFRAIAERVGEA